MKSKKAYAVGILILALGIGCAKRPPTPSIPDNTVADLAAWVPEEMEVFVVVSSLEEFNTAFGQLKTRSSLKQLEEFLEEFQEEAKEEAGLDLFSLSTWKEMGLRTQAPLAFGADTEKKHVLFALPVADQALFLDAFEKNVMNKGKGEAQPGMPQGLHAWKMHSGDFVVLTQKPDHALALMSNDLEALQKMAQLSKEKSWSKHKEALLKISSRLPAGRVVSAWVRLDEDRVKEAEWVGAAVVAEPRAKVVVDVVWRQGQKAFWPKMQAVPFNAKQWPQGLSSAVGGFWSSATWDWYTELLKAPQAPQDFASQALEKLDAWKQNFEPPVLLRAGIQTAKENKEDFHGSLDVLLKKGSDAKQALGAWLSLVDEKEVGIKQPNPGMPIWKAQLGKEELSAQALEKNRVRISNSLQSYAHDAPDALQKLVVKEMMSYPMAAVIHLNALMKFSLARLFLGEPPEKEEYLLLGVRAEEDHMQFIGEHFVEATAR
jgi:hypothetical protein